MPLTYYIINAWNLVTSDTIKNCFDIMRFYLNTSLTETAVETNTKLELQELFICLSDTIHILAPVNKYLNIDENIMKIALKHRHKGNVYNKTVGKDTDEVDEGVNDSGNRGQDFVISLKPI